MKRIISILILICAAPLCAYAVASVDNVLIVHGKSARPGEVHAAQELGRDVARVYGLATRVAVHDPWNEFKLNHDPATTAYVFVGTPRSNPEIARFIESGALPEAAKKLGSEAFLVQSVTYDGSAALAIVGSDQRGVLYGAYEYSRRLLGVDPYEYWTGKTPAPLDAADFSLSEISLSAASPVFPLRGYFDNDDDMIANWKDPKLIIEFDTWKEMIDSLARLRYNYVDLHDTLGRAEFWNWPYYTNKYDYHADLELIDKIIDYVHSKGMLVQIPMYLGWEFHHLPIEKICLSRYHDDWMEVYEYYLTKTPLGKADLFLQRPRDPWWDRAYRCEEEEKAGVLPGPLMTRMFDGLKNLVDKHRPGGKVICDLWAEGRQMWDANNFNPGPQIDVLWADGGYANYNAWPEDRKGHNFGVYIHAGYYLNHVMQDPYPGRIKEASSQAARRGLTHNYLVNGQDFKHFILNMEACALAAWDPESFDPEAFYLEWTARYFGAEAAPVVVESLKALHEASAPLGGFTKIMDRTEEAIALLRYVNAQKLATAPIEKALAAARESLALAEKAAPLVPSDARLVYDDQVLFPAKIFLENLKLYKVTAQTMNAFYDAHDATLSKETRKEARAQLTKWKKRLPPQLNKIRALLTEGSSWKKWEGWTNPDNFRKITPPPDPEDVKRIIRSLK